VTDPFVLSAFESAELTVAEEDELTEKSETEALINRYGIILAVSPTEYPIITKKVLEALLPSTTSYLCEARLSVMNTMRSKNRSQLQTLEEDLRVCLSTIRPRTRDSMRHQAQVSH
jgi:hypothetical protein